jgi:hypothetical protein
MALRLLAVAAIGLALPLAPGATTGAAPLRPLLVAEARTVASELFRSINTRRYERTCDLLVAGLRDRNLCVTGLRVGLMWSQEIAFRITGTTVAGRTAIVYALADGAPGRVLLVRRDDRWRVLSVEGA